YFRTVWLATFHIEQIAGEIDRPVSYRDARLFQLITIAIAWLPVTIFIGALDFMFGAIVLPPAAWSRVPEPSRAEIDLMIPLLQAFRLHVPIPLGVLLFFLGLSGVSSYFFHPR